MFTYEDLKNRIDKLNNGWDNEANDLIQEIHSHIDENFKLYSCIKFVIPIGDNHTVKEIKVIGNSFNNTILTSFNYCCESSKKTAFKSALLWLLDHSSLKKNDSSGFCMNCRERMTKPLEPAKKTKD